MWLHWSNTICHHRWQCFERNRIWHQHKLQWSLRCSDLKWRKRVWSCHHTQQWGILCYQKNLTWNKKQRSILWSDWSHTYQHAGIFFLEPLIIFLDYNTLQKLTGTRSDGTLAHIKIYKVLGMELVMILMKASLKVHGGQGSRCSRARYARRADQTRAQRFRNNYFRDTATGFSGIFPEIPGWLMVR